MTYNPEEEDLIDDILADLHGAPDTPEVHKQLRCDEAIGIALEALEGCFIIDVPNPDCVYTDAAKVLRMILAQQGCKSFDSAGDGSLTDLMDIVIFG